MTSRELVVAHFEEDLKWLRRVPEAFAVTVYDKGGRVDSATALPNVGREAHSYLHHIVNRYELLADVTVFCQGRPFDHVPDFHKRLCAMAGRQDPVDFEWMGFVVDYDDASGSRLFRKWSKNVDGRALDMRGFARHLWGVSADDRYVFYPGAHFAVASSCILKKPRTYYEHALRWSAEQPDAAHSFERCWDRVFGCNGIPSDLRCRPLPIYLRPIRRLGLTWDAVSNADGARSHGR